MLLVRTSASCHITNVLSFVYSDHICEQHDNPADFLLDVIGFEEKSIKGVLLMFYQLLNICKVSKESEQEVMVCAFYCDLFVNVQVSKSTACGQW